MRQQQQLRLATSLLKLMWLVVMLVMLMLLLKPLPSITASADEDEEKYWHWSWWAFNGEISCNSQICMCTTYTKLRTSLNMVNWNLKEEIENHHCFFKTNIIEQLMCPSTSAFHSWKDVSSNYAANTASNMVPREYSDSVPQVYIQIVMPKNQNWKIGPWYARHIIHSPSLALELELAFSAEIGGV